VIVAPREPSVCPVARRLAFPPALSRLDTSIDHLHKVDVTLLASKKNGNNSVIKM